MSHVFISYLHENSQEVQRLVDALREFDIDVWLDHERIKPGHRWQGAIRDAIREGAFFIACFSHEYNERPKTYLNEELTLAIEELRQRPTDRAWFIPVLLSGEVPNRSIGGGETLRDLQWVELSEDWEDGIRKIVSVIKPDAVNVRKLIQALKDPSQPPLIHIRAIEALGTLGDAAKEATPTLIETMRDEDSTLLKTVMKSIVRIGTPAVETLLVALHDEDGNLRTRIVTVLGEIGNPVALPSLLDMLDEEQNVDVRTEVVRVLRLFDDATVIPHIVKALKDENANVRAMAAAVLGEKGDREAVPQLIEALKDEDIRWWVAEALGKIGDPRSIPPLIDVLKDEACKERDMAAEALGKIGDPTVIPHLGEVARTARFGWDRLAAVVALGQIGDPAAIPYLSDALSDWYYPVREATTTALGEIRDSGVIPHLSHALSDEHEDVRSAAIRALEKLNEPEAQTALEKFRSSER